MSMTVVEALAELTRISDLLAQGQVERSSTETKDGAAEEPKDYALEFAQACRAFHRRGVAAKDCRPELRLRSEEQREQVLDASAEDSVTRQARMMSELVDGARRFHRQK